jgi:hypothetical protein
MTDQLGDAAGIDPTCSQEIDCPDDFESMLGLEVTAAKPPSDRCNLTAALSLANRGLKVFPLCDFNDGDGFKPIRKWQSLASCDSDQVRRWWKRWPDARVGLLAGAANGITVLDLDTKNGKDGVAALASLGFSDLTALSPVRVRTPSGGWHLLFAYEPRLKNSVSVVGAGIDVKTEGGFVVAPGSWKGDSRYHPDGAELTTVPLPAFPEALIPPPEPERAPVAVAAQATDMQCEWAMGRLQLYADQLAATQEGGRNALLNDAALWAGGAGVQGAVTREHSETVLWSAAEKAGLKKREFGGTFKSGWEAGVKKPILLLPLDRNHDFDEEPDDVSSAPREVPSFEEMLGCAPEPHAAASPDPFDLIGSADVRVTDPVTERLNKRHAVVVVRGRTLITTEGRDGSIDFGLPRDVHAYYENDRVSVGKGRTEPASMRWLRDPHRRSYPYGLTFAPGGAPKGTLNLWRGWAIEPDPEGSCALFLAHVRNVVCRGDADHANYVIGWFAHMVQHPEEKPGVGLVLRGGKGAGKDTVAEYVARMIGRRHAPTVAESDHIVGKFNARLENALLLHVQEGSWAGDRKAESVLKYIVTSDRIEIERKGIDSFSVPSVLRLFISANASWVVPASADERRWAIFEVADNRRGDASYFAALRAEMNGRGPGALLHYLSTFDLTGFNVRGAPETDGLRNQKVASLRNVQAWWLGIITAGVLNSGTLDESDDWEAEPLLITRDALRARYLKWLEGRRFDGMPVEERVFGKQLREMVPTIEDRRTRSKGNDRRSRQYALPCLIECRAAFDQWIGSPMDWDAVD